MNLIDFVKQFSQEQILEIEHQDEQFLALKKCWKKLASTIKQSELNYISNIFLALVIQNSMISYQIGGQGHLRRKEFAEKIYNDFDYLKSVIHKPEIYNWWYNFLKTSRYNKRLYNLKVGRLRKLESFLKTVDFRGNDFLAFYEDMGSLQEKLAKSMKQKPSDKTICFSVKMFGYASRIVFDKVVNYPTNIPIPLDSRLLKIYMVETGLSDSKKSDIIIFFENLSKKAGISPLHLDSILWIKYRNQIITKIAKK